MIEGNIAELGRQLEKEENTKKAIEGKVSWSVFIWVVGILTTITGTAGTVAMGAQGRVNDVNDRVSSIEGDIKAIQVRLEIVKENTDWIRNKLDKSL